jgi:uncharacterized membrane protein YphA (DoxX/SURF4 family)
MHVIARVSVGFVWIYHGVIPKLIFQHADELAIIRQAGVRAESAPTIVSWIGWAETVVGLSVLLGFPSARWPFLVTIVFGIGATVGVAIQSPGFLVAAFNPVSLNVLLIALAVVGLLSTAPAVARPGQWAGVRATPEAANDLGVQ